MLTCSAGDNVDVVLWSIIETFTAVICASLMCIRPLLVRILPTVFPMTKASGSRTNTTGNPSWSVKLASKLRNQNSGVELLSGDEEVRNARKTTAPTTDIRPWPLETDNRTFYTETDNRTFYTETDNKTFYTETDNKTWRTETDNKTWLTESSSVGKESTELQERNQTTASGPSHNVNKNNFH
jgi:hypothetical protein